MNMIRLPALILTAALCAALPAPARAGFDLTGSEHLDITRPHYFGNLTDTSTATLLPGGSISSLEVSGQAVLTVQQIDPLVAATDSAYVLGNGRINLESGTINRLNLYSGSVVVSETGRVTHAMASGGALNLDGGHITGLYAFDAGTIAIRSGTVNSFTASLQPSAGPRIDITGGSVTNLWLDLSPRFVETTISAPATTDLVALGLNITPGTVQNLAWRKIMVSDSRLNVTGTTVSSITARDGSRVFLSDTIVDTLDSQAGSEVNITGGSVGELAAVLNDFCGAHVNITGGSVDLLRLRLDLALSDHLTIGNSSQSLPAYGLNLAPGTVNATIWDYISATSGSTVDVNGGTIDHLHAQADARVNVTDGSVNRIYASGNNSLLVSGGTVKELEIINDSVADITGGNIGQMVKSHSAFASLTGGHVATLNAWMRYDDTTHLTIGSGSSIDQLNASVLIDAGHFAIPGAPTRELLAQCGTSIAEGAVSNLAWDALSITGTGSTTVSAGDFNRITLLDSGRLTLDGGSIGYVYAAYASTITLRSGTIDSLFTNSSGLLDMSGGRIGKMQVDVWQQIGRKISITGGTVDLLAVRLGMYAGENLTVDSSPTSALLQPYGVTYADGMVTETIWDRIDCHANNKITITGGSVGTLELDMMCNATILGGHVALVEAFHGVMETTLVVGGGIVDSVALYSSNVEISGGSIGNFIANTDTDVTMTGGSLNSLTLYYGDLTLSGGTIAELQLFSRGTVTLNADDLAATDGLTLIELSLFDGATEYQLLGTGTLSGRWLDGTAWQMTIVENSETARLVAIPEPTTFSLLMLGLAALLRRRRQQHKR